MLEEERTSRGAAHTQVDAQQAPRAQRSLSARRQSRRRTTLWRCNVVRAGPQRSTSSPAQRSIPVRPFDKTGDRAVYDCSKQCTYDEEHEVKTLLRKRCWWTPSADNQRGWRGAAQAVARFVWDAM
eukprot:7380224-Prymnesium_polylepis.1